MKKLGSISIVLLAICCVSAAETSEFNAPIVIEKQIGFKFIGNGRIDTRNDTKGDFTRLKWTGSHSTWAFQVAGRNFLFKDFTIENGGIWIPSIRGMGTGHGRFENVGFIGKGVKFGGVIRGPPFNGNAADCVFNFCYFRDCNPAFENTTSQNIRYIFNHCFFKNCKVICKLNGGGYIWLNQCYVIEGETLFLVTGNGSKFGSQQGKLFVDGLVYDQKQKYSPCILHDTGRYGKNRYLSAKNVFFSPSQFKKPSRKPLIQIDRDTQWTVVTDSKRIKEAAENINLGEQ